MGALSCLFDHIWGYDGRSTSRKYDMERKQHDALLGLLGCRYNHYKLLNEFNCKSRRALPGNSQARLLARQPLRKVSAWTIS